MRTFLELGGADEPAEILVTRAVLREQGQHAAIGERDFRADERPDPVLVRTGVKPRRAIDAVAIEERERGQPELAGGLGELLGQRGAAQEAEGAGRMEFDVAAHQSYSPSRNQPAGVRRSR